MTRIMTTSSLAAVIMVLFGALLIPLPVQADGHTEGLVQTVNGYKVTLLFAEDPAIGENPVHLQVRDAADAPVADASVEVMIVPAKEEHAEEGHGAAPESSSHNETPHIESAEPADAHGAEHQELGVFVLEPSHHEAGEYEGELHIEASGNWTVTLHLMVEGEAMQVEFPLEVKSSIRNTILITFAGANLLILLVAALMRSKAVSR